MNKERLYLDHGIRAISQIGCQTFAADPGTVLIRIKGTCEVFEPLVFRESFEDVLELTFDDIGAPTEGLTHFAGNHTLQILDFFNKYRNKKLVVHCGAGLSRSPAVAIAFAYFKEDIKAIRALSLEYKTPNSLVLGELKRVFEGRSV
jgi:predicted protein tyrosine phosphatase